jgi:hypothetical protein
MAMTPEERHNIVTRAIECRRALGVELARVCAEPWLLQREVVMELYHELCEVDRVLCAEVDWPQSNGFR